MYASEWNTMQSLGVEALKNMDRSRQARGKMLDRAGYAPQTTPSAVIHAEPGLNVLRFDGAATHPAGNGADAPAVLLVPAPIKRAYIWDLRAEVSVVRRWLERGYRVYQAEWAPLADASIDLGLADYADRLLRAAREAAMADSGQARTAVAGHSLGGILAAIHGCLYPDQVRATVLLEAPLHFEHHANCFAPLVRAAPDARRIAASFGQVPGVFLNMMSSMAEPHAFQYERIMDRWLSLGDARALATHMRVERWTHDEFALPGRLFTDIVESLYRNDELMRGTLVVDGRTVGPRALRTPLASVYDPRSKVIPPQALLPFHEAAASPAKLLLEYEGDVGVNLQHVGVLVGRSAHARIWPRIFDWLDALDDSQGEQARPAHLAALEHPA
ncbi:alpha/beta hydrolase [Massilia sp. 9096]|uniref:alpha/beta hydrolase n=1 Tax=Massilia sp. 9096 TaxID=1500894 RepID=UPI00068FFC76|nr:alpha/beta hydrolase [Massilia sp. 9096]